MVSCIVIRMLHLFSARTCEDLISDLIMTQKTQYQKWVACEDLKRSFQNVTFYSISESQFIDRELKSCIPDSGRAQNLVVTSHLFPLVLAGGWRVRCVGVVTGAAWHHVTRCCRCAALGRPARTEMGRGEEEGDTRDHGASGAQVWGKMSSVAARRAASSHAP